MAFSLKTLPWIEWLCHSNFSFLTGASHPQDYVQRAKELGYRGLGICDFDGLYGVVKAHRAMEKMGDDAPDLMIGAEIHLDEHHHLPVTLRNTIVLKALNHKGYRQLCSIINSAHKHSKNNAFLSIEDLSKHNCDQLVCLLPMRGLIRTDQKKSYDQCQNLKEIFPQKFYLVLSKHLHPAEDQWIPATISMGKSLNLPFIMSQDCFFHHSDEKDLCDLVQAIRLNKTLTESVPYMFVNDERSLKNLNEIYARYHDLPVFHEALANGLDLLEKFSFNLREIKYHYPQEMIPEGFSSQSFLEHLVWKSYHEREVNNPHIEEVIKKELQLIRILEFSDYFLTVWDIVNWARSQGILCQGRGSAANSTVCYMLGVTAVDPSLFDLLFERFLSLERGDPPDIDVDFEHERREEVIQYIYQRYGRPRAAMVANVITFRSRGAIRFVGKALGIPDSFLSKASEAQEIRAYNQEPSSDHNPRLRQLWSSLSERLHGFPRHMGIHSGGFIISNEPLDKICPQEPATMEDRTVVQWAKDDIEYLNLFKIDVLSLGMLTAVRKALDLVKEHYKQDISLAEIPHEDSETYAMIQRADTVGTFQIESRAQMSMLPRLRPKTFYDLVVQVGIIRPGPIQGGLIHPFLKRRNGQEPIIYPHPKLKPILERTMGVPIFQEQVMRVAMAVGNFTAGEADQLRKQIGAWSLSKNLGPLIVKLEEGMRKNGIKEVFIKQLIGHLQGFADYGFPESHAASFALLAYASSYLKCHFQEAFYTALLNSQPMGFYSVHALLQSAQREGSRVLPICIHQSEYKSTIESHDGSLCIRMGLHLVRGLSKKGAHKLLELREQHGSWESIQDYLKVNPLNRGDLTALVAANCLADFGISRSEAIWIAEAAPFSTAIEEDLSVRFSKDDAFASIEKDFDAFGTTLGKHPASLIQKSYWSYPIHRKDLCSSRELKEVRPNARVTVFGMILVRQRPLTAKGMVFFTLEDEYGFINLVFTPQISARYANIINRQGFICATGKLQTANEGHSILVNRVFSPQAKSTVVDIKRAKESMQQTEDIKPQKTLQKARNYM